MNYVKSTASSNNLQKKTAPFSMTTLYQRTILHITKLKTTLTTTTNYYRMNTDLVAYNVTHIFSYIGRR